jgi:hypothetical protein
MIDTHRAARLAAPARRASVDCFGQLIEMAIGQRETAKHPGFHDSRPGEIPSEDTQQQFRTVAGDIPVFTG